MQRDVISLFWYIITILFYWEFTYVFAVNKFKTEYAGSCLNLQIYNTISDWYITKHPGLAMS